MRVSIDFRENSNKGAVFDYIRQSIKLFIFHSLAAYWKRKYRGKQKDEPWYLLTNLPSLKSAIGVYSQRYGIEAMFKDCKTGGDNLEGSQASPDKLIALIILIALAMTSAWLQGKRTQLQGQEKYVSRIQETGRTRRRHSNFWIGLYGSNWLIAVDSCQEWVESMLSLVRNKKSFYQKGLRARVRASQLGLTQGMRRI